MPQEKFHYKSLEEVKQRAAELGVDLPFAADTHALVQPLTVRNITFPNRLGIAPMEGADSTPEGAPSIRPAAMSTRLSAAARSSGSRQSPLWRRVDPPRRSCC